MASIIPTIFRPLRGSPGCLIVWIQDRRKKHRIRGVTECENLILYGFPDRKFNSWFFRFPFFACKTDTGCCPVLCDEALSTARGLYFVCKSNPERVESFSTVLCDEALSTARGLYFVCKSNPERVESFSTGQRPVKRTPPGNDTLKGFDPLPARQTRGVVLCYVMKPFQRQGDCTLCASPTLKGLNHLALCYVMKPFQGQWDCTLCASPTLKGLNHLAQGNAL